MVSPPSSRRSLGDIRGAAGRKSLDRASRLVAKSLRIPLRKRGEGHRNARRVFAESQAPERRAT